jgi:H+-translocating NAD(P) transhydrogenase subunit alpha
LAEVDLEQPGAVTIGVVRETAPNETRVALVPDDVAKLGESGVSLVLEQGAGAGAFYADQVYEDAGARIAPNAKDVVSAADVLTIVRPPSSTEVLQGLKAGAIVVGFLDPSRNRDLFQTLAGLNVTAFAMELIPRITRAQSMDALSSMSTIAGYRSALIAAESSKRMFPMLITAAGTQPPCRVLVLGAGVAGLQALATAKRLGAITSGFDTRPEVREQVQSVGATFVQMDEELQVEGTEGGYAREVGEDFLLREQESIRPHVAGSDAVITTALIPGKPAPVLITAGMVSQMKPGSVIVDLAAESGGNCELTRAGEDVVENGVTIVGPVNIPGQVATQASQMYSRNLANFVRLLVKDGKLVIDMDDEILKGAGVTHAGEVLK